MSELLKKNEMTEEDIKLRYITPAIARKWDKHTQIRMEYCFTDGRVIVRGNIVARGKKKKADYILYYKRNIPLAIVEAKDNKHSVGAGMQQGVEYAEILDIPFVYSSNGERAAYGKNILSTLSTKLMEVYGNIFYVENIYRMMRFAKVFVDFEILSTTSTKLSWSHFCEIMRVKTEEGRIFYANDAVERNLNVKYKKSYSKPVSD